MRWILGTVMVCCVLVSPARSQSTVTLEEFGTTASGAASQPVSGATSEDQMLACLRGSGCRSREYRTGKTISIDDVVNLGIIDRHKVDADKAKTQRADGSLPSIDVEILFEYDSDQILPEQFPKIAKLKSIVLLPEFASAQIALIGHTDAKGTDPYNLHLSQRRASAVARVLASSAPELAARVIAKGRGRQQLKAPDRPFDRENRRVQVVLVPIRN